MVIGISSATTPSLGRVETVGGTFVFRGVPERVLETGAEHDRLVTGIDYRRAMPVKTLLSVPQRYSHRASQLPPPALRTRP
jgi:hypothetical protein